MEEMEILIEEERTFTPGRVIAATALVAGIGLAAWSAARGARKPKMRARANGLADAAKRAYSHPDRVARGNGKTIGLHVLETFGTTAAKALAGRIVLALFTTAMLGPQREEILLDSPIERPQPLPA